MPNLKGGVRILDVPLGLMAWDEVIARLIEWGYQRRSSVVCICNVHMTVTAGQDSDLAGVLEDADIVTPDGAPIAWAIRRAGFTSQERINGPDLMWRYLAEAERLGQVVFFYGGQEETLNRLRQAMLATYPNLKIGGMISPPFRDLTPEEDADFVNQINSANTAVLFVGLGCPKQEKWMAAHKGAVQAVMVGVGAAFDYHAGTIKRAPLWMQRYGLEWFHRLCSEPRRLWKRYLVTNTLFIIGMAKSGFKAKRIDR
ncbi:WecB/TagA/CpsF family glycosyltransferase [Dechloromonas denitrificans]|uniref:WecB/TagA/CpsF family glycosyltransferase n=1 Tax=Dechloromonas denitrificans TaxID=281362 RepID=UPI001CF90B2A|nr:WecB/TagA/CpsF family glycosyltransferase [Dechloromonas denitrificans]UCV12120.1 WecB/TagA/CpsF family glycosyltransferase [Dechloromonas denitrificans]